MLAYQQGVGSERVRPKTEPTGSGEEYVWFVRVAGWLLVTLFAVVVVAIGLFIVAPAQTLVFVIASAAAWNGIDAQGLDTLNIDLSKGTISAGPISFQRGSGKPGKLGHFEADVNVSRLLRGRVELGHVRVADVDLALTVEKDGSYVLNGIHVGGPDAQNETAEQKNRTNFHQSIPSRISVEQAHIEAVRVAFRQAPDLSLPLAIDHLRIRGLTARTPGALAKLDISGRARDVRFDYRGTIQAFGDPVKVALDGGFKGVTVEWIEMFTGPLGLTRRKGVFSADAHHELTLTELGEVELTTLGSMSTDGIALTWPGSIDLQLDRSVLHLNMKATATADGRRVLSNRGGIDVTGLSIFWPETGSLKVETAAANLDVSTRISADQNGLAALKGAVPLKGLVVAWSDTGAVGLADGTAQIDLKIGFAPDGRMSIVGPMAVKGGRGSIHSGESFKLSYGGIDAHYPDASIKLSPEGTATVTGTPRATMTDFLLDAPVNIGATTAIVSSGSMHVVSPPEGVRVEYDGSLDLKDMDFRIDGEKNVRSGSTELVLSRFRYEQDATQAAVLRSDIALDAGGVRFVDKHPLQLPVSDVAMNLSGLDLRLTPQGGIRRVSVDPATDVILDGTAEGRPNRTTLAFKRLEVSDFDPAIPDQRTHADILAIVNGTGRIELTEHVKPFARPPEFVFTGSVKDLGLPDLSPYFEALIGLNVDSGRFNAKGRATAMDAKLDGVVHLDIQSLDLEPSSEEGGDPVTDLIGVPAHLAVALLENSKQRIKVSLPFSGDLSSPDVDYCDVIRKALLGAVRLVVTAPLAGITSAIDDVTSVLGLHPVQYEAGSATLNAEGKRHLDKIATLLAKKRRLRLKLCGRATHADAAFLEASLPGQRGSGRVSPGAPTRIGGSLSSNMLSLAQKRTRSAIAYLKSGDGVHADQVLECRPNADTTDTNHPRVETRF